MQETVTIKGMHVGERFIHPVDDFTFRRLMTFCRQLGVEYVLTRPPVKKGLIFSTGKECGPGEEDYWDVDSLVKFQEYIESFDLKLGAMVLPIRKLPSIVLGTPERDRAIERICQCIEAAGRAGIPALSWSFSLLDVVRSLGWTVGRGGIMYTHFDYDTLKNDPPHPAGPISAEEGWERVAYAVERVIPVAEEYKVKIIAHPNDVPVPPSTSYRGIEPILNTIDEMKHLIDLYPSPYFGICFCIGSMAETATNPEQVYEAIRYFGERQKIFWVHFRNIRGGFLKFEESFPDEGSVNMAKALRTLKEVGYNGVLTPDHVPHSDLDTPWGHHARAFCYGYIKALIQAVESEN